MTRPIKKTITVPLDKNAAFDLFTNGIDRWWPKETHSLGGSASQVRVEPREGGRVIETQSDGREAPWGTVTEWTPGARFRVDWYVGSSPEDATQVDVRFTQTEAGTRVDLTHEGWAAQDPKAVEASARYDEGWNKVLGHCYAKACQSLTTVS